MKTEIILLIDESGSMNHLQQSVIEEINNFVKEQRNIPGECSMTLVKFDDKYTKVFEGVDIHSVPMLNKDSYKPNGSTALVGALGKLIDETGERLSRMNEKDRPQKVLFILQTDGGENYTQASEWGRKYTREIVAEKIKHQTDKYSWTFVFMGANQDSFLAGGSYGYDVGNTTNWEATKAGNKTIYTSLNENAKRYRQSNEVSTRNFFG